MGAKLGAILVLVGLVLMPFVANALQNQAGITTSYVDTTYRIAPSTERTGYLQSLQSADIMLSGIDFNNTGGPLLFNHPAGIASDGQHLVLSDRFNNRVLIWNSIPSGNTPPDLVLGQKSFYANAPGHGLDGLNWPTQVSIGGGKLVVADSYNHRILIWNTFPTRNDQPADLQIVDGGRANRLRSIAWPWGVWTDGTKMVADSTYSGGAVLVWNTFPTVTNQSADLYLTASGQFGTPRKITSDGTHLMVGDHSPQGTGANTGTFVWNTFPTQNDQPYDYFAPVSGWNTGGIGFDYARGVISSDGKTILLGTQLYIFNSFPKNSSVSPNVIVGGISPFQPPVYMAAGDGGDLTVAGSKLMIALDNQNKIVVFSSIPTSSAQEPDFAIGAPDIYTYTLETNYFLVGPHPVTDGRSLFVASAFYKRLQVYRHLPDQSGAYPDITYDFCGPQRLLTGTFCQLNFEPVDIALGNGILALVGYTGAQQDVYIWNELPLNGEPPDYHFSGSIGNVTFRNLQGVAIDSQHFYLADYGAGKIYVWNGIPTTSSVNPSLILTTEGPTRLSSDGNYLVVSVAMPLNYVKIYSLQGLSASSEGVCVPGCIPAFFGVPDAVVAQGHLFVVDGGSNRVLVWNDITTAMSGADSDIVLGCAASQDICSRDPEIGRNRLFWPAFLASDGNFLWVGEVKFSGRLLRFPVGTTTTPSPRTEFYDIQAGSNSFVASLQTNAATTSMRFSSSSKSLMINTTASAAAYVNATFPNRMLNGSLMVSVDGSPVTPQISHNATFTALRVSVPVGAHTVSIIGANVVTTTTSSTQITSTTSISSTSAGIASTTSSTTTSSVTPTASTSSATTSSTTSSTTTGGGGIPEFPYQLIAATVFTVILAASYLIIRRRGPAGRIGRLKSGVPRALDQ